MFSVSSIVYRSSRNVNSYSILGVSSSTSFDEIRSRFHELARLYHPDMANGDPVKFREVHAAYRELRALHRAKLNLKEKEAEQEQSRKTTPSEELWERIRKTQRPKTPPTEAYTWKSQHNKANQKKTVKLSDLLYETNGYEIIALVSASFILLAYFFKRCAHFSRLAREKREFYERIEKGLPEPMPLTAETKLHDMYYETIPTETIEEKSSELCNDVNNRKTSQKRFDDFREFMYIFDAENVGERKVTTERFSYEYLNEKDVFTRCPVVYEFNSENKADNYDAAVKQVQKKFSEIEWENNDAKYIGSLIALGLNGVSSVSPNTSKWTFIEYIDLDKMQKGKLPVCLAALRNHRYENVGMCQRVIVTGRKDLYHPQECKDKKNSVINTLKNSHLITGLPVPLKISDKFHAT